MKVDVNHVCTADDCCSPEERAARHELRRVASSSASPSLKDVASEGLMEQIHRMREYAALNQRPKERIPELLEAIRVRWEKNPDLRLLQLLVNVCDARPNPLFTVEDEDLLRRLMEPS